MQAVLNWTIAIIAMLAVICIGYVIVNIGIMMFAFILGLAIGSVGVILMLRKKPKNR